MQIGQTHCRLPDFSREVGPFVQDTVRYATLEGESEEAPPAMLKAEGCAPADSWVKTSGPFACKCWHELDTLSAPPSIYFCP